MVVAGVGSFVDYKKEVQFVKSRMKSDEKNVVSAHSHYAPALCGILFKPSETVDLTF